MTVIYLRLFHVILNFIWVGNLLALTRLMGYHAKLEPTVQAGMVPIYRRMNLFIGLPSMIISILLGLILMLYTDYSEGAGWFVLKLHFVAIFIGCQLMCGYYLDQMRTQTIEGKGIKYKILHGITGLALIGILFSIYYVHKSC